MERKLSDDLTQELTFLTKEELDKIAIKVGVDKRKLLDYDWFETVKFLSLNFEDEDMKELINQYKRNVEVPVIDEKERLRRIEEIKKCYQKKVNPKNIKKEHKKRGRKKGSGVKEKLFRLFQSGIIDYYKILENRISVKENTFKVYYNQWKKL